MTMGARTIILIHLIFHASAPGEETKLVSTLDVLRNEDSFMIYCIILKCVLRTFRLITVRFFDSD